MDEERFKIMQMLADGTITTDEADLLLEALEAAPAEPAAATGQTQRIAPPWREMPKQPARTFANLTLDQLIELRNHGVDPEFIQRVHEAGLTNLAFEQLLELGIHGVNPDFIREMRAADGSDLSIDKLVELRIHGVDPDFIRKMRQVGA